MEKFQDLRDNSKKRLQIAHHMLTQTYPLVKDTKLLLAVLENIFLAQSYAMTSLLDHERVFKKIPPFQDNFDSKFNMFRMRIVGQYGFDQEHADLLQEVKDIVAEHKKSPVEFKRKDSFVICSDQYSMKAIDVEKLKKYIDKTKSFIDAVSEAVNKGEEVFK